MKNAYKIKYSRMRDLIGKTFIYEKESSKPDCWAGRLLDENGIPGTVLLTIPKADLEPLEAGSMTLYGFCDGYFGRDSYADKIVEGMGDDWIVAREDEANYVVIAQFNNIQERDKYILKWNKKPNEYEDYEES